MDRRQNPNLEILELTVARLGPLSDQMVWEGVQQAPLLSVIAEPTRPTGGSGEGSVRSQNRGTISGVSDEYGERAEPC